jgi:hypothetical protein
MPTRTTTVTASAKVAGLHHWPDPTPQRLYLGAPHRHLFGIAVTVPVDDPDRQVEFHDLMAWAAGALEHLGEIVPGGRDFGGRSCEHLAAEVADKALVFWPVPWCSVTVDEDGECSATVRLER